MGGTSSVFADPSFYDDPSKSLPREISLPKDTTPAMDISGKESCSSLRREADEDEARGAPERLSAKDIFADFDPEVDQEEPQEEEEEEEEEEEQASPLLKNFLFSPHFLRNYKKLGSSSIETEIFLRFLFKQLWRNLIFPEIKYDLLQQTFSYLHSTRHRNDSFQASPLSNSQHHSYHGASSEPGFLDSSDDYNEPFPTSPSPKNPSFDKWSAIFAYFTMEQLQSILLGVTLSCFFQYRSSIDFAANASVDREELLNSLFIDGSSSEEISTKNAEFRQTLIDQGYYDGYTIRDSQQQQQLVVDPEDIFNMILRQSASEDFEYLLGNEMIWMNHYAEAVSQFPSSFSLWKISNTMISKSQTNGRVLSMEYTNKELESTTDLNKLQSYLASICNSLPLSGDSALSATQKVLQDVHEQLLELCLPMKLSFTVNEPELLVPTVSSSSLSLYSTVSLPLFSSFYPIVTGFKSTSAFHDDENSPELLTIHCPLNQLHHEPFFFPVIDFLFFSIAGLKQPSDYNI
jgi:hypothetical protein